VLHDAGRRARPGLPVADALCTLGPQLAPFICAVLDGPAAQRVKAKKQRGAARDAERGAVFVAGPLSKLPWGCQVRCVAKSIKKWIVRV
jgi:hypothetical protein